MKKMIIAIVNWNTGQLLAQCLQSLLKLPADEQGMIESIVVIDNASSDNSLEQARQAIQPSSLVTFKAQAENIGFAKANNIVISEFAETHDILLLNPDTVVLPGAISAMRQVLAENPKAGIIGPRLLNADGSLQPSVRALPGWAVLLFFLLKLNRFWPNARLWREYVQRDFNYTRQQPAAQVMGAAFLIRSKTAQEIGGLDEKFWLWFEEVDYCKRAAQAGWEVWYTPTAQIIHFGGVSFGQWGSWRRYGQFMRSAARYAHKHLI